MINNTKKIVIIVIAAVVVIAAAIAAFLYFDSQAKIAEEERTETVQITETVAIAFDEQTVEDAELAKDTTEVRQEGVDGVRTLVYEVVRYVHKDQAEISRELKSEEVTTEPIARIVAVGTKVAVTTPAIPDKFAGKTISEYIKSQCADALDIITCSEKAGTEYQKALGY